MTGIEEVENGLRLAFEIKGQPVQGMNIQERMAHHRVPGVSIARIQQGGVHWSKSYGQVRAGAQTPVTPHTLFQAASVSKPVAALGALALVEAGLLDLDRDVNQMLKSWQVPANAFTASEKVTLRRLLSHSAGLTVHGFPGYAEGDAIPAVHQVLRGEAPANTPPVVVDVAPGSLWRYSGGGTTVVQLLMEEAAGMPFAEIMKRHVLEPLGMSASTYEQPLPLARRAEAAVAHDDSGQPYPGDWHTYPEQAAAGLWTTPEDLSRYIIEVQRCFAGQSASILPQRRVVEMLTLQIKDWGLGPNLGGQGDAAWFSHGGSNAGFRCRFTGFIHRGEGFVVMTNGDGGDTLVSEIFRSAATIYGWHDYLPGLKQTVPVGSGELSKWAGLYRLEEIPELTLELLVEDGSLVCQSKEWPLAKTLLYPQSTDAFFDLERGFEIQFISGESTPVFTLQMADMTFHAKRS